MELISKVEIEGTTYSYNVSALVAAAYAAQFKKNIFEVFNKVVPIAKLSQEEQIAYLFDNNQVMTDLIELAFTSISLANKGLFESYEDFLSNFMFVPLLTASVTILSGIYKNNEPINKPRVVSKSKKK